MSDITEDVQIVPLGGQPSQKPMKQPEDIQQARVDAIAEAHSLWSRVEELLQAELKGLADRVEHEAEHRALAGCRSWLNWAVGEVRHQRSNL